MSRRKFLVSTALAGGAHLIGSLGRAQAARGEASADSSKALIAITLDLEMSRNFPNWDDTHWDYEKGNLNAETKRYCVEAARRVKAAGSVVHFFAVGRLFEQESVAWLQEIAAAGHPVGNHTYDHVNVLAKRHDEIQFRFRRSPWLIAGRPVPDVIRDNIRLTSEALKTRLDIDAAGFRTPGGFPGGLSDRPDLQHMLLALGFKWISCKAPKVNLGPPGVEPSPAIFEAIVRAQTEAQPLIYPSGLVDVPMSPISDVAAFRNGRWKLEHFLHAIRLGVEWAIEHRMTYDFLGHPSVLYPMDPAFRAIDLICDLVRQARGRATIVDLGTMARRVS